MINRCGKWLADWRDATGKRKRKAFPSKPKAEKHQRLMMLKADRAKKAHRPRQQRRSSGSGRSRTKRATE
jgi:hypothetical protein